MKQIAAWCALAVTLPACAGTGMPEGPKLASVAIANVVEDIARNTGIDSSQIPLSVQVPMDVAAATCGVATDTLVRQAGNGIAQCTAQRTSTELDDIVRQRVRENEGR